MINRPTRTCFLISFVALVFSTSSFSQIDTCDVIHLSEGFNSGTPPSGWTGDFDTSPSFDEGWTFADGQSTSGHLDPSDPTGPSGPYEGAYYIYYETSGPAAIGVSGAIQTPPMIIQHFRPKLSFYLYMFGSQVEYLKLNVLTSSGSQNLLTFEGQRQSSKNDPWERVEVDLSEFIDQEVRFEFKARKDGGDLGDIAIDQVEICSASSAIPTMSEWSLIILAEVLLIFGLVGIRQREIDRLKTGFKLQDSSCS